MAKLQLGDIVYCDRGLYEHYGIYAGNFRIIHFVSSFSEKFVNEAMVRETSIESFTKGDTLYITDIHDLISFKEDYQLFNGETYDMYTPAETVARARQQIGCTDYDLLGHNCEHFVVWCKTGLKSSSQTRYLDNPIGFIVSKIGKAIDRALFQVEAEY